MTKKIAVPLPDCVLVKPDVEPENLTTKSGLILLKDSKIDRPRKGTVVAVGAGTRNKAGKLIPLDVQVGDRLLYSQYAGHPFSLEGEDFLVMKEQEISLVLTE